MFSIYVSATDKKKKKWKFYQHYPFLVRIFLLTYDSEAAEHTQKTIDDNHDTFVKILHYIRLKNISPHMMQIFPQSIQATLCIYYLKAENWSFGTSEHLRG